jgi:putative addiction module component (TIGR02574 family)
MTIALEEIRKMPVGQRVQLVEDIWDTLSAEVAELPLSDIQMAELEGRRARLLDDPSIGIPWETAKARLEAGE